MLHGNGYRCYRLLLPYRCAGICLHHAFRNGYSNDNRLRNDGQQNTKKVNDMGQLTGLIIVLGGTAVVGLIFLLWTYTKSGKKWLSSL